MCKKVRLASSGTSHTKALPSLARIMQQTTSHNCVFFNTLQYANVMPLHVSMFLPLRTPELWRGDFWVLLWMSDSNESVTVVFGTSISLIKHNPAPFFSLIKKSHQWCISLALKSRIGLYSQMRRKYLKYNICVYNCLSINCTEAWSTSSVTVFLRTLVTALMFR